MYVCTEYFSKMAKKIKAIKCPQCGSTKAKELREDYYRCESCRAEFFIDSDDIVIHHKYEHPLSGPLNSLDDVKLRKRIIFFALIVMLMVVSVFVFSPGFLGSYSHSSFRPEKIGPFWSLVEGFGGFANDQGEGMILLVADRTSEGERQPSFGIYRADNKKEILIRPIKGLEKEDLSDAEIVSFENGDVYAIINESRLFKLNLSTYELEEIIFEKLNLPELAVGVHEINFYDRYGDALHVLNNLGKRFCYYPLINQVYPTDNIGDVFRQVPPDAKKRLGFRFSTASREYPDERIQLLKYYYWHRMGYPFEKPCFEWKKLYNYNKTTFTTYQKGLLSDYGEKKARLISYQDFTPDRHYLWGRVMACNDDHVLISFRTVLSGDPIVQLLDSKTAEVLWTIPSNIPYWEYGHFVEVKDGFLFTSHKESWLVNTKNKTCKYFKWDFDQI
ncbi:hypothetical protein HQ45_08050 [Porphyromonas crevioricanis]|nr:hypothetical protein HQ45_08050 [Porphyromonas crevioricanis]